MNAVDTVETYVEGDRAIPIVRDTDVVAARLAARALASRVGFMGTDLVLIASAVSEVARNIVAYAGPGEVILSVVQNRSRLGLQVIARDRGPGIADMSRALEKGFSTSRSLGLGLPGSKQFMDEFRLESTLGLGTTVTMRKWLS
ncbi:MAG TPA: ATP-binding protein [Candidatus Acidoferrum sp.]|jgi:serine/threonine-protein kinase RsbT|nr:ATP-binding protein [Candidatus Acidoferrum sp.]HTJ86317.1 ATP-binding protein [Terriglobales bacterium]HTM12538.1 ATP-binding protein [Bryobacteraceae bacterium]